MDKHTHALYEALRTLAQHTDEDVPMESRSRHLNNALAFSFELLEALEELNNKHTYNETTTL
jgi:hypothetical protein